MAIGAIRCAIESGLNVPTDISIMGFDDISLSSIFIPSITTIRQLIYELGQKAMESLVELIKGKEHVKDIIIPIQLVARQSTTKRI